MGIVWSKGYDLSKKEKIPTHKLTISFAAAIPELSISNSHSSAEQIIKDGLFISYNSS